MQAVAVKVYRQDRIVFILTPEKVIVITSFGQQFYLLPKQHYFNRRLNLIRTLVALNEIRSLNELAEYTGRGIEWVTTSQHYDIDKLEALA